MAQGRPMAQVELSEQVREELESMLKIEQWQSVARLPVRFVLNLDWFRRRSLLFLDDFTQRDLRLEFAR